MTAVLAGMRHYSLHQNMPRDIKPDAVIDIFKTKKALAGFRDIAVDKFPSSAGNGKVNPSSVPKYQFLCGFVAKTGRQFRKWHLEPVVDFVMRTSIPRILARGNPLSPLNKQLKQQLSQLYQAEFDELEQCMQIDLSCWRK